MAAASSTHSEETKAIAIPDGGGGDPEPAKGNSYAVCLLEMRMLDNN